MKVAFHTLGCKVNTYETAAIWKTFEDAGYEKVDFDDLADVYVINTCSVTNTGDSKSRQYIRRAIKKNPDAVVVAMGCYVQMNEDEVSKIEGVDIVLGNKDKGKVLDLVEEFIKERKQIKHVNDLSRYREFEELDAFEFENTRAFLKIQDGCNNFCTYCIIPFARGRLRSRSKENVLLEAKKIVDAGYKEIVLTGIHTGGYGEDLDNYKFSDLVSDLLEIKGLERLRISSIEINQIDDKLLNILKNNPKLVNHFHLPIQSGSNSVLKAMNRKYNVDEFIKKIDYIREFKNDISITTDVIVGFPNETDEDFLECIQTIKKVGFSELHVFPYSKRNGTKAALMPQVDGNIKKERVKKLLELSDELALDYAKKFQDKILDVIPETYNNGKLIGHTSNYLKVEFEGNKELIGEIVNVKIVESNYPINKGVIIK